MIGWCTVWMTAVSHRVERWRRADVVTMRQLVPRRFNAMAGGVRVGIVVFDDVTTSDDNDHRLSCRRPASARGFAGNRRPEPEFRQSGNDELGVLSDTGTEAVVARLETVYALCGVDGGTTMARRAL